MIRRLHTMACDAIPSNTWARLALLNMGADLAMVVAIWVTVAREAIRPAASACLPAVGSLAGFVF